MLDAGVLCGGTEIFNVCITNLSLTSSCLGVNHLMMGKMILMLTQTLQRMTLCLEILLFNATMLHLTLQ